MSETWGKAHINNSVNWGQNASNSVGFGSVYRYSYSGQTILGGLLTAFINEFKQRIEQDNGIIENINCIN